MTETSSKPSGPVSFHYAWIVAGVTFLVLIVTAGVRATPGVLMVPLEAEFGWSRAAISAAVACVLAGTAFLTVGRRSFSGMPAGEAVATAPA